MATNINIILNLLSNIYNNINSQGKIEMKFSKSERQFHKNNYNPPCNVYQPDHILNSNINTNKVLTGSLATPSIMNKNTFGYQSRFDRQRNDIPGPGTYTQISNFRSENKNQSGSYKNKAKYTNLLSTGASPSIPYSYYGQDKTDLQQQEYIKTLLINENIQAASKKISKKNPMFSFGKSQKTHTYIPKTTIKQQIIEDNKISEFNKQQNKGQQNQQNKNNHIVWQQKIKRANQRRLQVIQSIDPEFVPSLQLIQLIKNRKNKPVPGPGDYQLQNVTPEFQIFQNPKGVSFTTMKRFSIDKATLLGPGLYNPKNLQKSNKFSFGKSQRNVFQEKKQGNFRFYIDPQPEKEKQSMKSKQRAVSCPFGSSSTRFTQKINNQGPSITLQQQKKRAQNQKLFKMIRKRIKAHQRLTSSDQKQEGLLGISTMASTIQ